MKRYCLMIFLVVIAITILHAQKKGDCLAPLKEKAASLKKYTSYEQADELKKIVADIITGMRECGFSGEEIKPVVKFQEAIESELKRLKKNKEKLHSNYYSNQILIKIENLEKKSADSKKGETGRGPLPSGVSTEDERQGAKKKDQEVKNPPPITEKKIISSFPAENFTTDADQKKVKKPPVTTVEALKTRIDLMEQRIAHLTGSVGFYRYAFIFLVIIAFILAGLMVLLILVLRGQGRKLSHLEQRISLMHREDRRPYRGD